MREMNHLQMVKHTDAPVSRSVITYTHTHTLTFTHAHTHTEPFTSWLDKSIWQERSWVNRLWIIDCDIFKYICQLWFSPLFKKKKKILAHLSPGLTLSKALVKWIVPLPWNPTAVRCPSGVDINKIKLASLLNDRWLFTRWFQRFQQDRRSGD